MVFQDRPKRCRCSSRIVPILTDIQCVQQNVQRTEHYAWPRNLSQNGREGLKASSPEQILTDYSHLAELACACHPYAGARTDATHDYSQLARHCIKRETDTTLDHGIYKRRARTDTTLDHSIDKKTCTRLQILRDHSQKADSLMAHKQRLATLRVS